jgi:MFS transporter, DHA1 family, tetracycline resistance protein
MTLFNKYASLSSILLMFFMDVISIGLAYPIFSSMIFSPSSHLLAPETSQAVKGLWLGIILALVPLAQFFSAPILGTLSDRIGRKKLLLASIALGTVGYAVAVIGACFQTIILLAISRIIIGIATGNQAIGGAAIADLSTPEEKAKNFGLLHMAGGFGFTVGPLLGGKLSTINMGIFSGFAAPFLCAGALTLINLLLVAFLFKETHVGTQKQDVISFGLKNIKRAWYMPGFALLFLAIFVYNFGWSFYWDFIPVNWIASYSFDASMVYNRYAWGAIIYAISSGFLIRPLVSRFKTETIFLYALIGCAFFITLPLLFSAAWLYWIYIPMQQFLIALIFPTTAALISNKSSNESQGEMMGILESVQSLSYIISPLIAGPLLGFSVKMPLIIGALALLFAAYILWTSKAQTAKAK